MSLLRGMLDLVRFSLGATLPLGAPFKVQIEITHRCNSRCRSCYFWRRPAMGELAFEDWQRIITGLAGIGARRIAFGGGEPTLYPRLCELTRQAHELGMRVSLGTNALLLNEMHERIATAGIDVIEISLDGPREVHDGNRGLEGAFERTMAGVAALRRHPRHPLIQFNYTPNVTNAAHLLQFAQTAVAHGAQILSIEPAHPLNDQLHLDESLFVPAEMIAEFQRQLEEVIARYGHLLSPPLAYYRRIADFFRDPVDAAFCREYRCVSGYLLLVIDPRGDVYGCPAKERVIGNAADTPIARIWRSRAHGEDNARVRRGEHAPCWLNSVAPINMVAGMVGRPRAWPRLLGILARELGRRI